MRMVRAGDMPSAAAAACSEVVANGVGGCCLRERFGFTHGEIEPVSLPPVPALSELARLQELEASLDRDTDK